MSAPYANKKTGKGKTNINRRELKDWQKEAFWKLFRNNSINNRNVDNSNSDNKNNSSTHTTNSN